MATPNSITTDLHYTAQFNGKTVRVLADCGELKVIEDCLEQCPELHIEQDGDQWLLEGRPVSESDVFEYLMRTIPFGDEPEALEAPAPAPTATPFNRKNLKGLVSSGSIFNVEFIKRTTGELRSMTCRRGVTKGLKGGQKSFSDKSKDLLTVWDMQAKGYRSIPVDAIQSLKVNGQTFSFAEAA